MKRIFEFYIFLGIFTSLFFVSTTRPTHRMTEYAGLHVIPNTPAKHDVNFAVQ